MADVIKTATRDAYGKALAELGEKNEKLIVLDADLAAATKTGMFKKVFPERFYDCGIAEGNMMGIAAGLAASYPIKEAAAKKQVLPLQATQYLQAPLQCLQQAEPLNRSETQSVIPI